MKKIGIDARLYFQTGVGVYIRNLLFYLQDLIPFDWQVFIYLMKKDSKKINFKNKNFVKREANFRWHSFSEQIGYVHLLYKDRLDLMHFTYFSYPILYKKKFVATVHDLTPLIFKTGKASTKNSVFYQIKYWLFQIVLSSQIKNASSIITPSQAVKHQIINHYGKRHQSKIFPIYEGINQELVKVKENLNLEKKFKKDFFIYVGNFYPHKNLENLIKAFSKIEGNYQLVLIGPDDFFSSRLTCYINTISQNKRIIFYHNAKKEDLVFFYKNAKALIHPSLSEGFGLPLIEAVYFKTPIIASNIEVFKEILGDQYLFFDPNNLNDIVDKINMFLKKKVQFDYKNISGRYSFQEMTKRIIQIYNLSL